MAADLYERIWGIDTTDAPQDTRIPPHGFAAGLAAWADGRPGIDRAAMEVKFDIPTTGIQATQLDFMIDTYTGITGSATQQAYREINYKLTLERILIAGANAWRGELTATWAENYLTAAASI